MEVVTFLERESEMHTFGYLDIQVSSDRFDEA